MLAEVGEATVNSKSSSASQSARRPVSSPSVKVWVSVAFRNPRFTRVSVK